MISITIGSSESVANIQSNAQELHSLNKVRLSSEHAKAKATIDVVVGANVHSVTLATRPVAIEKALKTQRLNQALEMGYVLPLKSTSSK